MEALPVMLEGGSPHAPGIDGAAVHALMSGLAEDVVHIGTVLPMQQIVAAQDLSAGEHVHGSGDHVIAIAHAHHVRVGEISMYDRVDGSHGATSIERICLH